jgi:hypothetical protein
MSKKYSIFKTGLTVLLATLMVGAVVNATTTVGDNVSVGGTLGVTGISTLTGATSIAGALAANGGITVDTANFTVNGTTGAVATASTLAVTGTTALTGALTTTGGIVVPTQTSVAINGTSTLTVGTGATVLGGTLAVTGAVTTNGNVTLGDAAADVLTVNSGLVYGAKTITTGIDFDAATLTTDIKFSDGSTIATGVVDDTTLTSIAIAPIGSIGTTTRNELVNVSSTFGSSVYRTYGLVLGFDRDAVAGGATFDGVDSGLYIISSNEVANNAAYDIQGAFIKARNKSGGVVGLLRGLNVEVASVEGATTADIVGQEIAVQNDSSTATANAIGLKFRRAGSGLAGLFTDIQLQNDATITNSTADVLTVTEPTITLAGATKINLDGPVDLTGALNLDGSATGGLTTPLFGIGVYGTPKLFTPATVGDIEIMPLQVNISSGTDGSADANSLMAGYFGVRNTADFTKRQLQGILSSVTMVKDAFAAYGVQGHVSVTAGAQSHNSGNIAGLSGKVMLNENVASGVVSAGLFTLQGDTGLPNPVGATQGIWIEIDDVAADSGLLISKSGSGTITNEITLSSGAAIMTGTSTGPSTDVACVTLGSLYLSTGAGGDTFHCTVVGAAGAATWEDLK